MKLRTAARLGAGLWLGSILVVAAATLPGRAPGAAGEGGSREFRWADAGTGMERFELRAASGVVRVAASPDDSLRVRLAVRPDSERPRSIFSRARPADLSKASLASRRREGDVQVQLEGASFGRRVEEWTIEAPQRLAARVSIGNGDVEVAGIAGGVHVRANSGRGSRPGRIEVRVPSGSVDAEMSVGTVTVRTGTDSYSNVQVRSGVGDAHLWIEGHRILHTHPPDPGSRIAMEGEGRDRISARVRVGDAEVRIR